MNLFLFATQLIGGIGLFVLGISMISDGFRLVAGEGLRNILGRWTNSLGRGMVGGAGLTAVAQSWLTLTKINSSTRAPWDESSYAAYGI